MRSDLIFVDTKQMDLMAWLQYRKGGVGASDVGCILGLDQYKASIQLFYEKIGDDIGYNVENIHMFMGKEQEAFVADLWQYWGGSEESMIVNKRQGQIIRKCRRMNAYVLNPKYPWLFVSLDRIINKHDDKEEGALEIKTLSGHEQDKWESGIPPKHLIQVQTQMGVCGFDYGELAVLRDGRRFEVTPFPFNPELFDGIVEHTHEFWQKVERGKEILIKRFQAKSNFNYKDVDELTAELAELEPQPDGSDAYTSFMKEKYKTTRPTGKKGTPAQYNWARDHQAAAAQIKQLEEQKRLSENKIRKALGESERLDFGKDGFVSLHPDVNGVRRFINRVK